MKSVEMLMAALVQCTGLTGKRIFMKVRRSRWIAPNKFNMTPMNMNQDLDIEFGVILKAVVKSLFALLVSQFPSRRAEGKA